MGFNNRPPSPVDPDADPLLPQADSSQGHDIPTGVSPTTAKLQDWIAWLRENGVIYLDPVGSPGLIANDITVGGDLTVTGDLGVSGPTNLGSTLAVGGTISAPRAVLNGSQPAANADPGANTLHSTNVAKFWAYVETDGSGNVTVNDAFNLASASVTGLSIRFTFARGFTTAMYAVSAVTGDTASFAIVNSANANYVDVGSYSTLSSSLTNPSSNIVRVHVTIMGRH